MAALPTWWPSAKPHIIGDCLEGMKELPDECVDAVVTDPPYGIGFNYNTHGRAHKTVRKAAYTDTTTPEAYWAWLEPRYREMRRVLKPGGFFAIWQSGRKEVFSHFWEWFGPDIYIYASCKNFSRIYPTPINQAWDPIICFYKPGADPLRPTTTRFGGRDFFVADTASNKQKPYEHPCPRPLDQVRKLLHDFVLPGGIVLDPFLGAGTLLRATRMTGRIGLGFEIDETYEELIRTYSMTNILRIDAIFEE